LNLSPAGALTNEAGTSLTVTGLATLTATTITLGNNVGDAIDFAALTTNTSAVNGNQNITETNGIAGLNLSAGTGAITLITGGSLTDNDATDDFVAADLILQTAAGIGTAANPINTNVNRLDVNNTTSGGIFVSDTAGGLTLADLGGANSNAVSGVGGGGQIR